MFFDLGYRAHGGSGLGYDWAVVQDMPLAEVIRFVEMLDEARTKEAAAMKRAHAQR